MLLELLIVTETVIALTEPIPTKVDCFSRFALDYFISNRESLVKIIRFLLMQTTVLIMATKLPWLRYHIILCHIISVYMV